MNLTPDDLLDQVRELLPSVLDESDLLAAAEMLAATLNAEHASEVGYETERARDAGLFTMRLPDGRAFQGRTGGGVVDADIWSAVPDASIAAQHTVRKGRNKKGPTAVVTHRGVAPVIGAFDRDVDGRPILAAPGDPDDIGNASWCAAQMLAARAVHPDPRQRLHRLRAGWSAIDVQRLTDQAYALDPDVTMIGTDDESWAERQIARADRAVRWSMAGMSFGGIVAQSAEYVSHTSIVWPSRYTLNRGRRRQGDPVARRTLVLKRNTRTVAPTWLPSHEIVALPAPADDAGYMFVGFTRVQRAEVKVKRGGRKARTIMAASAAITPNTAAGWQALAEALNTGDRITAADGLVSICRTKDRYTATDTRDGKVRFTVRTPNAVGLRLAS